MHYPLLHFYKRPGRQTVKSGVGKRANKARWAANIIVLVAALGVTISYAHAGQFEFEPTIIPAQAPNGSLHPPMFQSSVGTSRDVDLHPQAASAPTNKVHTQMRLEFLQKLFAPDTTGSLSALQKKQVGTIENALYGKEYTSQSLGKRLQRVEASVFGEENLDAKALKKQPVTERLNHILTAVQHNPALVTYPNSNAQLSARPATALPSDAPVALGYMEERLYHQRHVGEANQARIARIETTLYGQPNPSTALAARFSRLQERFPLSAKGVKVHATGQPTVTIMPIQHIDDAATTPAVPTPTFSAAPAATKPTVNPYFVEFSAPAPSKKPRLGVRPAKKMPPSVSASAAVALPAMVPAPVPAVIKFTPNVPRGLGPRY